jgi:hypothetical protein
VCVIHDTWIHGYIHIWIHTQILDRGAGKEREREQGDGGPESCSCACMVPPCAPGASSQAARRQRGEQTEVIHLPGRFMFRLGWV